MNFTIQRTFSSFLLPSLLVWQSWRSLFCPLRLSSFLPFSLVFSSSFIAAKASSTFIYFCASRIISAIVLGGFFESETTNSLDFNPTLKVVNCTLSLASSTSKVSQVKHFTYDLRVSFSFCLMVSKWSAGLFRRCPPTKCQEKALPNCSKLSKDDVGNFVNYFLATPLRVMGKERHSILSKGYWRPSVVLKVLRWSRGSLRPSNYSSWGRRNFDGTGHSRTAAVKCESVVQTILSRLQSVFPLMAFLNLSISFLISQRRSEFGSSKVVGLRRSHLLWLSSSSSWLILDQFSSCWTRSLISWFCLIISSTVAASAWTCRANAARPWLDSIWI